MATLPITGAKYDNNCFYVMRSYNGKFYRAGTELPMDGCKVHVGDKVQIFCDYDRYAVCAGLLVCPAPYCLSMFFVAEPSSSLLMVRKLALT